MTKLSNMAVRDIETVIHPYTNLARHRETGPLILNEGRGIYLYDDKGKRYIEGMAGLWCTALGYGNTEVAEAGAEALRVSEGDADGREAWWWRKAAFN